MKVNLKLLNEVVKRASAYTVEGLRAHPVLGMLHIKTDSAGVATIAAFGISGLITIALPIEDAACDLDFMVNALQLKKLLKGGEQEPSLLI